MQKLNFDYFQIYDCTPEEIKLISNMLKLSETNSLEKKSLVVRVPDQIDHRIKRVILTNAGKQLFYDVLPIMEKTREEVRGNIPEEEIQIFKNVLSKIIKNLKP